MAVTIGEITVETAPTPDGPAAQTAGSGGGASNPADTKKEIEKTLQQHASRVRRLWDY